METLHQPQEIIAQRYRIVVFVGQGGMGITYEAEDLTNYQRVAIKVISLRNITEWKVLELFEREAKVLANLNHPSIPRYLDYFQVDTPNDRRFYLVQELVAGYSLDTLIRNGWRANETDIKQIAIQVLSILKYLHSLTPPVIHRDIKPQNIIWHQDGRIFLVDFGAVQDIYRNTVTCGGTFVGTLGYMPPEQFRGQVCPASDLYSVGATLLFLLTGKSPYDLPLRRMKIEFRSQVQISDELAYCLEKMLEPIVEDRFHSAIVVLKALQSQEESTPVILRNHLQPKGSKIVLNKNSRKLVIDIPSGALRTYLKDYAGFTLLINGFLLIPTMLTIKGSLPLDNVIVGSLILAYLINLLFVPDMLFAIAGRIHLEIDQKTFLLQFKCLIFSRTVQGKTEDIRRIELLAPISGMQNRPPLMCTLIEKRQKHQLSDFLKQMPS